MLARLTPQPHHFHHRHVNRNHRLQSMATLPSLVSRTPSPYFPNQPHFSSLNFLHYPEKGERDAISTHRVGEVYHYWTLRSPATLPVRHGRGGRGGIGATGWGFGPQWTLAKRGKLHHCHSCYLYHDCWGCCSSRLSSSSPTVIFSYNYCFYYQYHGII